MCFVLVVEASGMGRTKFRHRHSHPSHLQSRKCLHRGTSAYTPDNEPFLHFFSAPMERDIKISTRKCDFERAVKKEESGMSCGRVAYLCKVIQFLCLGTDHTRQRSRLPGRALLAANLLFFLIIALRGPSYPSNVFRTWLLE
jgi:hypothetical protein